MWNDSVVFVPEIVELVLQPKCVVIEYAMEQRHVNV